MPFFGILIYLFNLVVNLKIEDMKKKEEIVMYDNPSLVGIESVNLFVGDDKRGYQTEHQARYANCTHRRCDCGEIMPKHYTKCQKCRSIANDERYSKLKYEEWDFKTPLTLWDGDEYFFDIDSMLDYCDTLDVNPSDLQLIICIPNKLTVIDEDYWCDEMPEDMTLSDVAPEFAKKLNELNEFALAQKPISWSASNVRTKYIEPCKSK